MTNAKKYLKDGVDVDDFVGEFNDFCAMQTSNQASSVRLAQFLSRTIKPQLTDDERVILRNIDKKFIKISRDDLGLYFIFCPIEKEQRYYASVFNNVFQFIKERRRI